MELTKWQELIGSWADKTFDKASPRTITTHLLREAKELDAVVQNCTIRFTPEMQHEVADILILLLHLSHRAGFGLENALNDKFEICLQRKWQEPDEDGVVEHVRTPDEIIEKSWEAGHGSRE